MKKLLLAICLLLGFGGTGLAQQAEDGTIRQRNLANNGWLDRFMSPPIGNVDGIMYFAGATRQPAVMTLGGGLTVSGGVLSATGSTQVNSDWAATSGPSQIVNKPTTLAGFGITDGTTPAQLSTALGGYATTSSLSSYATVTALTSGLSAKFNAPVGNTAQYLRGDGSLATFPAIPTIVPFAFGLPFARTLALSTAYQATDPSKSAVIVPSYSCTNATTVLAASGCTIQVRMSATTLTCSTGTVYYTQSLTVALGVLITQASIQPVPISLATGAYFILCPTAGTFTVSAIEQTAG